MIVHLLLFVKLIHINFKVCKDRKKNNVLYTSFTFFENILIREK